MSLEKFEGWSVVEEGRPFEKWSYTPRPRGPFDIDIKIICCGLCASDVHQIENGWGGSIYPMIPGHEIIGNVVAIGESVTKFKIGDRVGVGAQVLSCLDCEECNNHEETYCLGPSTFTYNSKYFDGHFSYGGYAKHVRVHEHFTFHIPENLDSFSAAPLLCAGITTYDPLVRNNVRGKKLGVLGVGGLGHLAVKFGVALGNEVVGISRNPNKREGVLALGAVDYISTQDPEQLNKYKGHFDFILCTINDVKEEDWPMYQGLLRRHGTICLVGVPNGPYNMPVKSLIFQNRSITGTLIGPPSRIEEMLQFCSLHNIVADVQVFPIEQVNEVYVDFKAGKPRYRFVFKIEQ